MQTMVKVRFCKKKSESFVHGSTDQKPPQQQMTADNISDFLLNFIPVTALQLIRLLGVYTVDSNCLATYLTFRGVHGGLQFPNIN